MKKLKRIVTAEETTSLISYDFYKIYNSLKKTKLIKSDRINDRKEYLDFCRLFFKIVSEELLEREAGVCIRNLGYFYMLLVPRKAQLLTWKDGERVKTIPFHTDGRRYAMSFMPNKKRFRFWSIEAAYTAKNRKEFYKRIINGQRYNGYPHSTETLK